MDILIAITITIPLTAFTTIFFISAVRVDRENEIYMEGFNDGHNEGYKKGLGASFPF